MAKALRVISVQRGHDPREFSLLCFGGAGGLHLCELAEALDMNTALVPIHGGVFSALGMLAANPGREFARTWRKRFLSLAPGELDGVIADLAALGEAELAAEGTTDVQRHVTLDLRYQGQTFTLNLPRDGTDPVTSFHDEHERQYGHRLDLPVELVNVRVHLEGTPRPLAISEFAPGDVRTPRPTTIYGTGAARIIEREALRRGQPERGPVILVERNATTLVAKDWEVTADTRGNLELRRIVT